MYARLMYLKKSPNTVIESYWDALAPILTSMKIHSIANVIEPDKYEILTSMKTHSIANVIVPGHKWDTAALTELG